MEIEDRLRRLESQMGAAAVMAEFGPWRDWWRPQFGEYPPVFPPAMPERVQQHFLTFVLMDLSTGPRPLSEIPEHIRELLPAHLVGHLRRQFPSDAELAATSDATWLEWRNELSLPHFQTLTERRQALRALENQKGNPEP